MTILHIVNNIIKELQTHGAYTLITEFTMLGALIKYLLSNSDKRNSKRHQMYKQLLLNIEPRFQDLDNNRNGDRKRHENTYELYVIHATSIRFNMPLKRARHRIQCSKYLTNIVHTNAKKYAYRAILAELELWADTLNHNILLRYLVSKYHSKEIYVRIYSSHKEMFYNKNSVRKYSESIKLYNKWK